MAIKRQMTGRRLGCSNSYSEADADLSTDQTSRFKLLRDCR